PGRAGPSAPCGVRGTWRSPWDRRVHGAPWRAVRGISASPLARTARTTARIPGVCAGHSSHFRVAGNDRHVLLDDAHAEPLEERVRRVTADADHDEIVRDDACIVLMIEHDDVVPDLTDLAVEHDAYAAGADGAVELLAVALLHAAEGRSPIRERHFGPALVHQAERRLHGAVASADDEHPLPGERLHLDDVVEHFVEIFAVHIETARRAAAPHREHDPPRRV